VWAYNPQSTYLGVWPRVIWKDELVQFNYSSSITRPMAFSLMGQG